MTTPPDSPGHDPSTHASTPDTPTPTLGPVVLFDGVCNLCNASVQWIIRHDRRNRLRFASLQSQFARDALARAAPGTPLPDSVVLLDNATLRTRSDAAIAIARRLGFPFTLAALALVIPRPIRDTLYDWIARNRYRWFGQQNACMIPTPALRARFLDAGEPRPTVQPTHAPPTPTDAPPAPNPTPRPTFAAALAESARRVGLLYFFLYMLPFPLGALPFVAPLGTHYEQAKQQAIAWLSKSLGGPELTIFPAGSGDTTYNYIELLVYAILALALGLLWASLARFRPVSLRLRDLFTTMLRFYLGAILISYGWVKVFPLQFPAPGPANGLTPYADSSPMGLLWRFMGASPAYQAFAGLGEVIAGTLLFWRRTTPLAAALAVAVLLQVVVLNFCYDVPVKLFSSHLLLAALVLLAPHTVRILSVLLLNLPAQPVTLRPFPVRNRPARWARALAKAAVVFLLGVVPAWASLVEYRQQQADAAAPSLRGLYRVESFTRDGIEDRDNADDIRWVRFGIGDWGYFVIQHADASVRRCHATPDLDAATIALRLAPRPGEPGSQQTHTLTFTHPEPDLLRLEGSIEEHHVIILARKQEGEGLLSSRGFHWINEYPFNR